MRYGDTIVWDGHQLRRYPKAYKDQARRRHRMLFTRAGFDPVKIAEDDPKEMARLTIWSWLQLEAAVSKRRGDRSGLTVIEGEGGDEEEVDSNYLDEIIESGWPEEAPADVVRNALATRNSNPVPTERSADERRTLPVMAFSHSRTLDTETGESRDVLVPQSTGRSLRRCDSCYVASSCPAMVPGSECAFDLPVEIRTKEQLTGTLTTLLEMQAQRVAFGRYAEELEGGSPDPNVSQEMDRFFKMTALLKEIQDNRDFFKIQVEARGNAGVLSRIFGEKVGEQARELPAPIPADQFDQRIQDIIDGEIVQ